MGFTTSARRALLRVGLGVGLGVTGLFLLTAASARADVWVVSSTAKVFPDSTPASARSVSVSLAAARNEYEAAQIAVSGPTSRHVTVSWDPASDPLLLGAATLRKVGYVTITKPSTGAGSRRGRYPDPLLPAAFDTPTRLSKGANAFYLQVHVPLDATAGIYRGALIVTDSGGAQPVRVPVTLTVYDFGWTKTKLSTAFGFSIKAVLRSVAAVLPDTAANRSALGAEYYRFFADHDISPTLLMPAPRVDHTTGEMIGTQLTDALTPFLGGSDGAAGPFADTSFPLLHNWPWAPLSPSTMRARLSTYLDQLFRLYVANGWQNKGYLYVWDEPDHSQEVLTARLATLAHAISAPLGFRARLLVTDWPRTQAVAGHPANKFLFDRVDIWCPSVYHLFDSLPELARQHAAGATTWWYSYASFAPSRYPTFLIDEPLGHERVVPWVSWRYGATGFLYWGTTRWGNAVTGQGYRDPYRQTLSYATRGGFDANGDACLIYPGYEPSRGLNDPYAGPVSSLRLETLRDGIEDYEYLRLAGAHPSTVAGRAAAACSRQVAAAIADYRYGAQQPSAYRNLPVFASSPALYEAARSHLADYIVRSQAGLAPRTVSGTVCEAVGGHPVPGARVSDGVVATTTDHAGHFTLPGVLPNWRLAVSHPLYGGGGARGRGDDATLLVGLTRRGATRLLDGFDTGPGFVAHRGGVAAQTTEITGGIAGARVTLRGGRAAATLSLPPGRRDLRHRHTLGLDVFSPGRLNHAHPWYLTLKLADKRHHWVARTFILRPGGWTHLSLPLRGGGLHLRHLTRLTLRVSAGTQRLDIDSLSVS